MRIAVLGTGMVGQALAAGLAGLGHTVTVGTRDVDSALARTGLTPMGTPEFGRWHQHHDTIAVAMIGEATRNAELIVLAVAGVAAADALGRAESLTGTTVLDVTNPLDFAGGMPPKLSVVNDDSLGEQLQRQFPDAHIVKSLNTVTASLMVAPDDLRDGDHTMFIAGNSAEAKEQVRGLLVALGWRDVLDLGDITASRGMEMYLPLWLRMFGTLGTATFSIKVVR